MTTKLKEVPLISANLITRRKEIKKNKTVKVTDLKPKKTHKMNHNLKLPQ